MIKGRDFAPFFFICLALAIPSAAEDRAAATPIS